ncbi:MAG: hypothetical protein K2Y17_03460 [Qipengyuania sp.]|nr:hypothetical protein [Qipengyuania sp.]
MADQSHGKRFEDFVKASGLFPGSADQGRSPTSGFDIEARFDRERGLPTSVKTTGNKVVALSDARRFFDKGGPYRMIVGRYLQVADRKEFAEVHEFILTPQALAYLQGSLTSQVVNDFHNGLLLSRFPLGAHVEARRWAREQRSLLAARATQIVLNPKVDSQSQRRLQCSVSLASLSEAARSFGEYRLHAESFGNWVLPIVQNSPRRRFKPR